jgi:dimethylhistidine N-methyltransferase
MLSSPALPLTLRDYHPQLDAMQEEVLSGLRGAQKTLPCKYFYDAQGSRLFDAICELPEYYLTRTELTIMRSHVSEMAAALGPRALLVEPGSGSSLKTRLLLDHLKRPAGYVPVDISRSHLLDAAERLHGLYPELEVLPVCADFNQAFELPEPSQEPRCTAVYFPGSTLGNFGPAEAVHLLDKLRRLMGADGALLLGGDLQKDPAVLQRAYDDASGVTRGFNLNLLARINRELDGNFDLNRFRHRAVYDAEAGCIEMHLVSAGRQMVRVAGESFGFHDGEHILSERSYKYTLDGLAILAQKAGLTLEKHWLDEKGYFCVAMLRSKHS